MLIIGAGPAGCAKVTKSGADRSEYARRVRIWALLSLQSGGPTAVLWRDTPVARENPALKACIWRTWLPAADVSRGGHPCSLTARVISSSTMGSPFPKDARLCAALNLFWPSTDPDVGRAFGQMKALPLPEQELGFHPKHPRVPAGEAASRACGIVSSAVSLWTTERESVGLGCRADNGPVGVTSWLPPPNLSML